MFDIFDDAQMDVEKLVDVGDGEAVLMLLRAKGTARHSGIEVALEWGAIVTIRDGNSCMPRATTWDEALEAAGLSE